MPAPVLDPRLLEILACPAEDHAALRQADAELVCTSCGRRYPIVDGIPVLLLTEAEPAEPTADPEAPAGEPGTVG
ncbi:Trm112 family protein [Pseudonocardia pini]|uniref:Trm112 family protein n=1 Tax=Pseudonocardia pini TaxID=2758030 RepID=UPI0015F01B58|nr:Trm112 family protein [Pseudonocardia pini]